MKHNTISDLEKKVKIKVVDTLLDWGIRLTTPQNLKRWHRDVVIVLTDNPYLNDTWFNPITYYCTPTRLNRLVERIDENVYPGFIRDIIRSINHYCEKNLVVIDQIPGNKYMLQVISAIEILLESYGIPVENFKFSELEYIRIIRRFGGRQNWEMILDQVISQKMVDMPPCYTCKYCVTHRDGYRECKKVFVPIDERGSDEKTTILRLNKNLPISNAIDDIRKTFTFKDSKCECFVKRSTKLLDWVLD